jgi:hypothetical protein
MGNFLTQLETWMVEHVLSRIAVNPTAWADMLNKLLLLILGPQVHGIVTAQVAKADLLHVPGSQKQAIASTAIMDELKTLGIQIGTLLLNLAIEIAVAYLRSKTGGLAAAMPAGNKMKAP